MIYFNKITVNEYTGFTVHEDFNERFDIFALALRFSSSWKRWTVESIFKRFYLISGFVAGSSISRCSSLWLFFTAWLSTREMVRVTFRSWLVLFVLPDYGSSEPCSWSPLDCFMWCGTRKSYTMSPTTPSKWKVKVDQYTSKWSYVKRPGNGTFFFIFAPFFLSGSRPDSFPPPSQVSLSLPPSPCLSFYNLALPIIINLNNGQ